MSRLYSLLVCLLLTQALPASSHELQMHISATQAVQVQLRYSDGAPFAHKRYELLAGGATQPSIKGQTDAQGSLVFAPGQETAWQLRAFSGDGHGLVRHLNLPGTSAAPETAPPASPAHPEHAHATPIDAASPAPPDTNEERPLRILLGLAFIFCCLGCYRLGRSQRPAVPA